MSIAYSLNRDNANLTPILHAYIPNSINLARTPNAFCIVLRYPVSHSLQTNSNRHTVAMHQQHWRQASTQHLQIPKISLTRLPTSTRSFNRTR